MNLVNLAEGVNIDLLKTRKVGDVLGFNQEGVIQHYKIKRINKKAGKWWAERINLSTKEDAERILNDLDPKDIKTVEHL
jgi:hypothetical protein